MIEYPILFSGPMVRALLSGNKTQTRRIVKPKPDPLTNAWNFAGGWWPCLHDRRGALNTLTQKSIACPYGERGDRLWVRETWRVDTSLDAQPPSKFCNWPVRYEADGAVRLNGGFRTGTDGKTRVSIHMPRWASRITLEITSIRVERLNDISEEDAAAEGCRAGDEYENALTDPETDRIIQRFTDTAESARDSFCHLWQSINGHVRDPWGLNPWDLNPWVWVVEFAPVQP